MKDTDFEDRLARNIPKNVAVYHKAADGVGFVHDAGIIDDGKNPFVLVVMTSEIGDPEKAKSQIGKIAEFIYKNQQ
jgi:rRNA processing protein Gar1